MILLLLAGFSLTCILSYSQNNLIRNHSFETRVGTNTSYPFNLAQLGQHCARWNDFNATTSDWFRNNSPQHIHASMGCIGGSAYYLSHPQIPSDDGDHYAGVYKWNDRRGEGLVQRLPHKLKRKTYQFSFDYFIPCDSHAYEFDLFFGATSGDTSYHARFDILPSQPMGVWRNYQTSFNVPQVYANKFEWFVWVFNGTPDLGQTDFADGSYMFVDKFSLIEQPLAPCTTCDPGGLISYNAQTLNFMTVNNDGNYDQWCIQNINNVSWYRTEVYTNIGVRVRTLTGANADGFENYSICWDGRNDNGTMLPLYSTYDVVTTLGNCSAQFTFLSKVFATPDPAADSGAYAIPNYVPPLFGLEPPPTHYRNLHLYGGIYWGTHDWFACDAIWLDNVGAPRVPYFIAGTGSNLGFYSTNGTYIDQGDVDFQPGSDIDISPQPVQCCPPLRLANPDLPDPIVSDIGELSETDDPLDPEENGLKILDNPLENDFDDFSFHVYPVPATDFFKVDFYLPSKSEVKVALTSTSGIVISEILHSELLAAGYHSYSVSVKSIPDGMYFLQLSRSSGVATVKVIVQR